MSDSDYTKGKWRYEYSGTSDAYIVIDVNDRVIACHLSKANASRICQCANNFDGLLDTLEKIAIHSDDPDMATLAKAAIAESKKEN